MTLRTGLAGVWVLLLVCAAAYLSFGYGRWLGRAPDTVHVAAHIGLFAVLAWLLGGLGPWRAFTLAMAAGAGIEVVQMFGAKTTLWREASFDLGMDALGCLAGLQLLGTKQARSWVQNALHPGIVVLLSVGVMRGAPLWFAVALIGLGALVVWQGPAPWRVLTPLLCAIPVSAVSGRWAVGFVFAGVLATGVADSHTARFWLAGAWLVYCGMWALG